jgi:hypothetical protein
MKPTSFIQPWIALISGDTYEYFTVFVYESTFGGFKYLMFKNLSHGRTPESCVGEVYVKQERHSVSS